MDELKQGGVTMMTNATILDVFAKIAELGRAWADVEWDGAPEEFDGTDDDPTDAAALDVLSMHGYGPEFDADVAREPLTDAEQRALLDPEYVAMDPWVLRAAVEILKNGRRERWAEIVEEA